VITTHLRADPSPTPSDHDVDGWYPDPCDPTGARERRWDGVAWTPFTHTTSAGNAPRAPWHRRPLAFIGHRWFHWLLASAACSVAAWVIYERAHGVPRGLEEVVGYVVVAIAVVAGAVAAVAFASRLNARLELRQVVGTRTIALVCAVSLPAVVAISLLEKPFPARLSNTVAGPIEELAKLSVPMAMYLLWPRCREPLVGLSLVLASAGTFGVYEVADYTYAMPADTTAAMTLALRPLWDAPVHMVLTGTIAAVLWRRWHVHGGFVVDLPVVVTVVGVMALHSAIDWGSGLRGSLSLLSVALLLPAYLWFKMVARQLVPPDAVATNPPWWRPWRLPTAIGEPQGSTRTSDPAPSVPGRTTAA
jgi:hypothetical protein